MNFTSERLIPEYYKGSFTEFMLYLMHIKCYLDLEGIIGGKGIDYGCGLGYGTNILGRITEQVTGVDLSSESIEIAKRENAGNNINFTVLSDDRDNLPFKNEELDYVVSFQVIEHIRDMDFYLSEIKRVLKPGGKFICTTPNGFFRLYPMQNPWNQHHLREFNCRELYALLSRYFSIDSFTSVKMHPLYQKNEKKRVWMRKTLLFPFSNILIPDSLRKNILEFIWLLTVRESAVDSNCGKYLFDKYLSYITTESNDMYEGLSFFVTMSK